MKQVSRRRFMAISAGAYILGSRPNSKCALANHGSKKRRLLFNWDGSVIHCWGRTLYPDSDRPLTRDQFVSLAFTPIDGTAVDTVLFSFGSGNVAEYQSSILEWPGEADGFKFPDSRQWHGGIQIDPKDQYLNPKSMADAGHNPPAVVVEECHRRGLDAFVSLRMNDTHDSQHSKGTIPNPELPTFKRQNPDWLVENLDRWTALDYRRPQVRALKLRTIEEFFDRWDFDGIELDWLRHTLNFPRGTEKGNAKYLTEFLRTVRKQLNARAVKRGKPIKIAVRVPERLEWCLLAGFDLPTWIAGDLVDMLILGQGLAELPTLGEFRDIMNTEQLPIYPCLYSYGDGYPISPDDVIRGNAANLWRDGADGLYTFNWFTYGTWRKHLLNEIADPRGLAGKDKRYVLAQRFSAGRNIGTDYLRFNTVYRAAQVPIELNTANGPQTLTIPTADIPSSAEVWISLDYSKAGDTLALSLNGHTLEPAGIPVDGRWETGGYKIDLPPGNGMIGLPARETLDMRFSALRWQVPVETLIVGRNVLSINLIKRGTGSDMPLQVSRVELSAPAKPIAP